ncbi:helix-loop-helix DNA-binding domain-domain-containing protein [Syncephalastrum racemosum]|uniref:Helix-loop-helix DNA-binding domain-domain-containing protein n=1 Tax=Syncephalastrum racemosum TaxID=13706 RepID=A0A1X2HE47_SYNRA|nr:helix-loop-helix DNA-binding domain-domain-containing protein [Syncephalastrum racemosum]
MSKRSLTPVREEFPTPSSSSADEQERAQNNTNTSSSSNSSSSSSSSTNDYNSSSNRKLPRLHYQSEPSSSWMLSPVLAPSSSSSSTPQTKMPITQSTGAYEREQQRRLSHSSIEKRRRERINDKIQQLKELIPSCNPSSLSDPIAAPSFHQPLHKLSILQSAIDYIEQLHQTLLEAQDGDTNKHNDPKDPKDRTTQIDDESNGKDNIGDEPPRKESLPVCDVRVLEHARRLQRERQQDDAQKALLMLSQKASQT